MPHIEETTVDSETKPTHEAKFADGDQIYTIRVSKSVEIYFSEVGKGKDINEPVYHKVVTNSDPNARDDGGFEHKSYYLYDHSAVSGGQPYFKDFINKYNPGGVQFNYDAQQ